MPLSVAESAMEARVTWRSSGMKQQLRDRSKGLRMMTHLLLPSTAGNDRLLLFPNVLEQLKSKAAMINSAMAAGSTTLGEEREDEDEVEEVSSLLSLPPLTSFELPRTGVDEIAVMHRTHAAKRWHISNLFVQGEEKSRRLLRGERNIIISYIFFWFFII